MIRYRLGCANHHSFESWFRDSAAFDSQVADRHLSCPMCGSDRVAKSIMAPAVVGAAERPAAGRESETAEPAPPSVGGNGPLLDTRQRAVRAALGMLRDKILSEGQNVGRRFPEEARKMHDGAIPERPIHGQATPDEARGLIEDGIVILPVPVLPEELN